MKKVLSLVLLFIIMMGMIGTVNAAFTCNVSMQIEKTEYKKGDEFTVNINISNIQSDRGVISLGATLDYDKDSLTLVKMEGQNGWETPAIGASYNENNGKIAITRGGPGNNNETVFKITFKVKQETKKNLLVSLRNISIADGTSPLSVKQVYKNITIQEGTENPVPNPIPDDNDNTLPVIPNTNNTVTNDTTPDKKLPQTGVSNVFLVVGIVATISVAVVCFVKMRDLNRK